MLTTVPKSQMSVERFRHILRQACGAFEAEAAEGQRSMNGTVMLEERVGLEMAHVAKDLQTIRRTKREIKQDSGENFFLIVQEEGRALMSQSETVRMLQPGDIILIDSAIPSEFTFFGEYGRQLSVHLPRREMHERFGQNLSGGLFLPRTDFATVGLCAVLAKAFCPTGSSHQTLYLREAMLSLLGAVLYERSVSGGNARDIDADVSGAQLLNQGLAYLDSHFRDGNFSVQQAADALGVSIRQIQRAFSLVGTTPSDYLLHKRLECACQQLIARNSDPRKPLISTIAYSCGFNDVSYFNRQFRRYFGCAPGKYGEG